MKSLMIAALIVCAATASAYAGGLMLLRVGQADGSGGVPVSGALLLEDGSSILLLEGGAGNLCLEGGC